MRQAGTGHPGLRAMARIWDFILRTLEKHVNHRTQSAS